MPKKPSTGGFCLVGEGKRSLAIARLDRLTEKSVAVTSNTHDSATSIIWYINAAIDLEIAISRLQFLCLINDILIDQVTLVHPFREQSPHAYLSSDIYFINFLLLIPALYNSESINHHRKVFLNKIIIYCLSMILDKMALLKKMTFPFMYVTANFRLH